LVDIDFLKEIPFFSSLELSTIEKLSQIITLKKFVAGDILFYEKDEQNEIYYLLDGTVKLYKVDRFDSEIFLYQLTANSMIFDIAKFCEERVITCYSNSEFLEDSKVLIFDSQKFKEIIKENQDFMKVILKESFKMIQQLQCIINRDVVFDGTAKVSHMIANDLDNFNKLKKHEIAYMLHIQPETLSRILKKLIRNETIDIEKNNVKILNIEQLKDIYE